MTKARRWRAVLAGVALTACAAPSYHKTCTRPLCELPCNEYVWGGISGPNSVFSLDPVTIEQRQPFGPGAPAGLVRERVKYYQMSVTTVAIDHCSLSHMALTLHENGFWTLSMRAHQNPWMTGPDHTVSAPVQLPGAVSALKGPAPTLVKETDSLKRNQFFVKVRCYAQYPVREARPDLAPGKPVLFELPTAIFWVQRGYPYDFWAKQPMPAVAQYFDLIDRVEVEFSYR